MFSRVGSCDDTGEHGLGSSFMTEWTDPGILVAIAIGVGTLLLGGFNTWTNCCNHWRERKRLRKQAAWEEYMETIYDPLRQALKNFQEQAKTYRRVFGDSGDESSSNTFFRELSEAMNEIKNACAGDRR